MARLSRQGSDCGCSTASPTPPHLHTPVAQAPWPPAAHGQVSVSLSGRGTPLLASDPNRSLADFLAHSSSGSGSGAEGSHYSPRPWPDPPARLGQIPERPPGPGINKRSGG